MTRWIVTADLHFSNSLPYSRIDWGSGLSDRLLDFEPLADFIIRTAREHKAAGLIVLGDTFDRNLLDAPVLTFARRWMSRMNKAFERVIVIPGNHENHDARNIHFTSTWLRAFQNILVPTKPKRSGRFVFAPYAPTKELRSNVRKLAEKDGGILLTHSSFVGATEYGHTFRDGLRSKDVESFDLVLSGHIHQRQKLPGVRGFYVGSPFCVDFRDESDKSITILEDKSGELEEVPIPSDIALPFRSLSVDLWDDGSIKEFEAALPEPKGYLRIKVNGSRLAIGKFCESLKAKLEGSAFRNLSFDRNFTDKKIKARAAKLGDGKSVDLRTALKEWMKSRRLPPDLPKNEVERFGLEILESTLSASPEARRRVTVEPLSLSIWNFGPIKRARKLNLDGAGLVLIRARNKDTTAADSNGSGKSHIFGAVTWVLKGRTVYGQIGNDVIRWGTSWTKVRMNLRVNRKRVIIERSKKTTASAEIGIKREGKWIRGGVADMQPEIDRILNLNFEAFRNTVLFGQNDIKRFADPLTKDETRKETLREILGTEQCGEARDTAKKAHGKLSKRLHELETERITQRSIISSSRLKDIRENLDEWEREHKEGIQERRVRISELESEKTKDEVDIPKLETQIKDLQKLEHEAQAFHNRLISNQAELTSKGDGKSTEILLKLERKESEIASKTETLQKLAGNQCPLCGSDLAIGAGAETRTTLESTLKESEAARDDLKARLKAVQRETKEAIEGANKKIADVVAGRNAAINKRRSIEAEIRNARVAQANVEGIKARLSEKRAELESYQAETNPHAALYEKAKTERKSAKKRLAKLTAEAVKLEREARIAEFWVDGFGNSGLQNWIIDTVIPTLSTRANEYLGTLSDGGLMLEMDTESYTKKGETRDKLSIAVTVEENGETRPSGGQQKKVELAVGLGLMDLVAEREGANIHLLMLDEVFDGLDATGKDRVMVLLGQLRKRKGTVLVVSHDPEARLGSVFDRLWIVTKRGGAAIVKEKAA